MSELPRRERVERAVKQAQNRDDGRVLKVLFLDEKGDAVGEYASSQLPENPFQGQMSQGLMEPPFKLEQLVYLAEMHPVHSAALEQKTVDICGKGWEWRPRDEDQADETYRDELDDWFESLSPDDVDMRELVASVELDLQTTGWGMFEVLRDPSGIVVQIYHVPSHTVRANKNGWTLAQVRNDKKVWFRRWGAPQKNGKDVQVDMYSGNVYNTRDPAHPANDLFVIRQPSRRSDWYGIPGYISAVGWITLALAARDDNLYFFSNRREPRWAIILSNLADDPDLEEDLRRSFQVDLRQPYRNILIPITGPGKVDFKELSSPAKDGSFDKLSERADKAIMIAHRIPSERLANATIGPLGGNATAQASRIYKEAVVAPGQELLNSRLNRFLEIEYAKKLGTYDPNAQRERLPWMIEMDDLDLGTDREELDLALMKFHGDLVTLREARAELKLEPLMQPKAPPPKPVLAAPTDPLTGQPQLDPAGQPVQPEIPEPVTVKTPQGKPAVMDPETGELYGEDVESPLNDKLFSQMPGVAAGAAGSPSSPPAGSGGLLGRPILASRGDALDALGDDVRRLWEAARETNERLEGLADEDQ